MDGSLAANPRRVGKPLELELELDGLYSARHDDYRLIYRIDAVGHEQQGRRYAVVLQSDDLNLSAALAAPTSTGAHPYVFRPEVTEVNRLLRAVLDIL